MATDATATALAKGVTTMATTGIGLGTTTAAALTTTAAAANDYQSSAESGGSRTTYAGGGGGQVLGAILGGIGGGVIGSQIGGGRGKVGATIAGSVIGLLVGSEIGRQLNERERLTLARTTNETLEKAPSGKEVPWRDPDSGTLGTVTPKRAYKNAEGRNCRAYQQTVIISGETKSGSRQGTFVPEGAFSSVSFVVRARVRRSRSSSWRPISLPIRSFRKGT